eukprot:COSAG01_NODE_73950_length_232_cov_11.541353_1_plen_24_part_01
MRNSLGRARIADTAAARQHLIPAR